MFFVLGSKNSYEIFKCTRSAIDPKIELSRYAMPQAGLKLIARHASQFNQYLLEDYEVRSLNGFYALPAVDLSFFSSSLCSGLSTRSPRATSIKEAFFSFCIFGGLVKSKHISRVA